MGHHRSTTSGRPWKSGFFLHMVPRSIGIHAMDGDSDPSGWLQLRGHLQRACRRGCLVVLQWKTIEDSCGVLIDRLPQAGFGRSSFRLTNHSTIGITYNFRTPHAFWPTAIAASLPLGSNAGVTVWMLPVKGHGPWRSLNGAVLQP